MTTITDEMIEAGAKALAFADGWNISNPHAARTITATRLILSHALAAAPDADPLARRVEELERQMRDLHKIARKEMEKMVAANYKFSLPSTPPAPVAEDAAEDDRQRSLEAIAFHAQTAHDESGGDFVKVVEAVLRRAADPDVAAAWGGEESV